MSDIDPIFTVEDSGPGLLKKRGPNMWLVFGSLLVVIAFVLGVRRANAKRKRSRPAVPTAELPT